MKLIFFINLYLIYPICLGEQLLSICSSANHPFKTKDNKCANFKEICVKKDDPECDSFYNLCSQCLPSNYSAIIFNDIQKLKDEMKIIKVELQKCRDGTDNLRSNFRITSKEIIQFSSKIDDQYDKMKTMIIIIIVFIIPSLIVLFVEIRFKLITKSTECVKKKNDRKYKLLESRKFKKVFEINEKLDEIVKQNEKIFVFEINEKLDEIVKQNEKIFANISVTQESVVKFRINDSNEQMELNIKNRDNITQIKKKIYSQLSNTKDNNYKIMKLKYNGNILDDNRYLLPYITDRNISVDCEIDHSINDQEIVIIKLCGDVNVPKLLQIHRTNTIRDLRRIISIFTDNSDYFIVKESNINEDTSQIIKLEILEDESTIGECKLSDGDFVKIIRKKSGKISVKSLFEEKELLIIQYSNTDLVSSIGIKLANKFGSDANDFHLFFNNDCLDKDKYIFEYNIDEKSTIKYYCLMKMNGKFDIGESIDKGYVSELYRGRNKLTNRDTLIMKYSNDKNSIIFSSGLIKYPILKSNPRSVKLYGIYYDENSYYVSMEYLSGRTLTTLLKEMKEDNRIMDLTEDTIIKWSRQILEGIKYYHDNDIIFKDIKPYEILIDENENFKFRSFSLSAYLEKREPFERILKLIKFSEISHSFLSPEIREQKKFDKISFNKRTDVWSFGVLLIDIINRKSPCIELDKIDEIIKGGIIKEKLPNWINDEMKDLIESCLRIDPNERSTVDQLLQHKLFKDIN